MINHFRHKRLEGLEGLERFFRTGSKAGIQSQHANKLRLQLGRLGASKSVADMDLPGWRLHALSGDLNGFWSVWVNGNWRLTFTFEGYDATLVD